MAFLLKYDSSLDFYLCKELIKSKTIVKKLFLKYCPCFLTNYQWSFCQMHLFIFHFYLLFCNWLSRPFFSPLHLFPLLACITMVTCYSSCASGLLLLKPLPPTFLILFVNIGINHASPPVLFLLTCLTLAGQALWF